ncbi:MAG: peptide chain release factor N(5)-glutamine methyltransferase [Bacteroidales bacterium]|nr:peptide chain release factor N(5)-glutamine methyltransferase [Bacteroidales bacterium]MBN2758631.1 peptide chain release factor N(5)-glutamine methyltransferase [Bacteroidales bacterium]
MFTIDKIIKIFKQELKDLYPISEINSFIEITLNFYLNFSKTDIFTKSDFLTQIADYKLINNVIERLKNNEPIQYILGQTEFYGLKFKVNKNVLIPRQETEELVDWIIKDNSEILNPQILDIGTGSGCIAVSLSKHLNNSNIDAIDISEEALNQAFENSKINNLKINPVKQDILNFEKSNYKFPKYDIIVSNPPYVRISEKKLMHKNVLNFEPNLALFVDDNNALIFYEKILEFAEKHLKLNGKLYFEINEHYGNEAVTLLEKFNFINIILRKDINGRNRMICGQIG